MKIILGHKNQVEKKRDTGKRQKKAPGRQSGGEGEWRRWELEMSEKLIS